VPTVRVKLLEIGEILTLSFFHFDEVFGDFIVFPPFSEISEHQNHIIYNELSGTTESQKIVVVKLAFFVKLLLMNERS